MNRRESPHVTNIPDAVYGISPKAETHPVRALARSTGELTVAAADIYASGLVLFGKMPGSDQLIKAVTRIPHVVTVAQTFGVTPKELVVGAIVAISEEPARRKLRRSRRQNPEALPVTPPSALG